MKRFALAGNPNCGKTTLFNGLTGSTAHVGNWPGVTVDKKEGVYKKGSEKVNIIDLPGIYSLSPYTPEEVISRDYILKEKPDCIINVVDATNLERNLYLTTQLMEIDVPMVIALNMMDEVSKNKDKIDSDELSKKIGLPVVEISALKSQGIDKLMNEAIKCSKLKRKGSTILKNGKVYHLINDLTIAFEGNSLENPLFHAVKLAELDKLETSNHKDLIPIVEGFKNSFNDEIFGSDLEAIIADERYKYISKNFSSVLVKSKNEKATQSDKVDKVLTNKWVGIPIFLLILFLIFHLTFSENLFYLGGLIKSDSFENSEFFKGLIWHEGGINSLGVMLQSLMTGFTDLLSSLASSMLEKAPTWVSGLIVDGILGGLFSVLSFLPQILLLFLFFSILEDTGYMARVAFILDRIFRKFGLSGRAFMPMIMGFGCSVPAMINTRTLADEKERTATIRVIPFFSCGAKLPILTAIAGGIVSFFKIGNADIITYSMYILGMITAIISIILMRNTSMRGNTQPFIMELPAYHLPQFKSLMLHLWDKLKHFIHKAFTIILASTIIIWFLSNFSWTFWKGMVDMDSSILASIGKVVQPLFTPLGFGVQLKTFGWVFAVASITGLIAKENVISTFGTLAACILTAASPEFIQEILDDESGILAATAMIKATGITIPGLISFIAFNMTTIPCFAAVATAKAELPKGKFITTLLFWIVTSYIVGTVVYLIGEFVWPLAIIVITIALVTIGITLYNKYHPINEKIDNLSVN